MVLYCIELGCNKEATRVFSGSSLCDEHFKEAQAFAMEYMNKMRQAAAQGQGGGFPR
jgi:hypothetical protein